MTFELPDIVGPTTILQGPKTKKAIEIAAQLTAFFSDSKSNEVKVNYGKEKLTKPLQVIVPSREIVDSLRIDNKKIKKK